MVKAQTSQLSITMFQNMSEAYQLPGFLEFVFLSTAFLPVNLPTLTTQVLHFICSLFYPISSRYLTIFVHFYVGFILFLVLLYLITWASEGFFSRGASRGFSQNFFQGGPKAVKFVFYPSKLKKQPFLLIILKSRGRLAPLCPSFRRPCFIISQRFSFYTSTIFLWHAVSHSYNVMVSFVFFVFVRHTAHCFLLLVSCMLYAEGAGAPLNGNRLNTICC